jgi:NAD(P)H-hydrate epimerase
VLSLSTSSWSLPVSPCPKLFTESIPSTGERGCWLLSVPVTMVSGLCLLSLGQCAHECHGSGGDGLVAARHLCQYGYQPSVYYPKRPKNDLYMRLAKQLEALDVPFVDDFPTALQSTDHVIDAIFGFSFSGEVREPFPAVIQAMAETKVPVTSVDAPSSWDIEAGPPESGVGSSFHPDVLISLTAPKPLVKHFRGRHFIGGRFVAPGIAKKYDFDVPAYEGIDQIVEVGPEALKL